MCTVSWRIDAGGYELLFNRDERRSRDVAEPPSEWRAKENGLRFFAPLDPEGGGSWIFVNELGLCAAVLNCYETAADSTELPPEGSARSRGRLLIDLAGCADSAAFINGLEACVLRDVYRPFIILSVDACGRIALRRWSGGALQVIRHVFPCFLTTSSRNASTVEQTRRTAFAETVADVNAPRSSEMTAFHHWQDDHLPEASVLMRRPDARTVSITRVQLTEGRIRMEYAGVADARPPKVDKPVFRECLLADGSSPL